MLQEQQHSQHAAWQSDRSESAPPFDFVVRILVPSSSCGMIIGKSGVNIRQMEEASGVASVRLSPKDIVDPNNPSNTITSATSERVVTLTGQTLDCCLNCLFIILDGMTSHPDICRYTNMTTSYSRITPDPFAAGQPGTSSSVPSDPALGTDAGLWDSRYTPFHQGGLGKRVSSSPDLSGGFLGHRPSMPETCNIVPCLENSRRHTQQYGIRYHHGCRKAPVHRFTSTLTWSIPGLRDLCPTAFQPPTCLRYIWVRWSFNLLHYTTPPRVHGLQLTQPLMTTPCSHLNILPLARPSRAFLHSFTCPTT
jgi:hypothetical protein